MTTIKEYTKARKVFDKLLGMVYSTLMHDKGVRKKINAIPGYLIQKLSNEERKKLSQLNASDIEKISEGESLFATENEMIREKKEMEILTKEEKLKFDKQILK